MDGTTATESSLWTSDPDRLQAFLSESLQRNERWIALADAKAGTILVLIPAIAALAGPAIVTFAKRRLDQLFHPGMLGPLVGNILYGILLLILAASGAWALGHAIAVVIPRVNNSHLVKDGVVFFGHVSGRTLPAWQRDLTSLSQNTLMNDYAEQVLTTAQISQQKLHYMRTAIIAGSLFLVTTVLAFIPTAL